MKNLIRQILHEEFEENHDEAIAQELINLSPKKIKRYPLSFFMVDENNVINLELDKNGFLWVNQNLTKRLSKRFLLSNEATKEEIMEYDITDGRLYVSKRITKLLIDLFGKNEIDVRVFVADWFGKKFNVDVEFVE
jgi:hypothetical protein